MYSRAQRLTAARRGFSALVCCGSDWWHYTGVLSRLHRAGVAVDLIAPSRSFAASSRYRARLFVAETIDEMIETLRARLGARRYDWVHVGDDPSLKSLAMYRAEAWAAEIFPIHPSHPEFDVLVDKNAFLQLLMRIGVPTVPGGFADDEADVHAGANAIGFPLAIKLRSGHGGGGVFRVDGWLHLRPVLDRICDQYPVRLERWIDRPIGGTQALFAHGELLASTSSLKVEAWPTPTSPSYARVVFREPLIEASLRTFGAATGYHGLCHPEWILMPDGTPGFLELNPRGCVLIRHDRYDDVDFGRAFAAFAGAEAYHQPPSERGPKGSTIYLFPQHLIYCVQSHDFRSLRRWLPFSSRHDIPWDDLGAAYGALRIVSFRAVDEIRAWLRQRGLEV